MNLYARKKVSRMRKRQVLLIVVLLVLLNLTGPILLEDLFYQQDFDKIRAEINQEGEFEGVSRVDNLNEVIAEYALFDLLSTYTTSFNPEQENRNENIRLASESINGLMLKEGAIFSFNEVVGPRTEARGYKQALEIVDGELVEGIGGGICQVTSTLYNAVLTADLEVKDRRNHSRPVSYVDKGRGATVYYDNIDFQFKNSSSQPIVILSQINNNQLTVSILGRRETNKSVTIETEIIEVYPPGEEIEVDNNLNQGEREVIRAGENGYKVKVTKVIREDGLINQEVVSIDTYSPVDEVIAVSPVDNR